MRTKRTVNIKTGWTVFWMLGVMVLNLCASSADLAHSQVTVEAEPVLEPAEHDHYAVAVNGIQVIIIRTGAGHSLEHRAEQTVERLGEVVQQIQTKLRQGDTVEGFRVEMRDGKAVVRWEDTDIISVFQGDATGYRRRDVDRDVPITAQLVAEYWRVLIEDVAFMFVNGEQPRLLTVYEDRRLLQTVYDKGLALAEQKGTARESSTELTGYFQQVLDDLSEADHSNLAKQYVRLIPRSFSPSEVAVMTYQWRPFQTRSPGGQGINNGGRQLARILPFIAAILVGLLVYRLRRRPGSTSSLSVTLEQFGERAQSIRMEIFELPPEGTIHFAPGSGAERVFDVGGTGALLQNQGGRLLFYPNPAAQPKIVRQGDTVLIPLADSGSVQVKVARITPMKRKTVTPTKRREVPSFD